MPTFEIRSLQGRPERLNAPKNAPKNAPTSAQINAQKCAQTSPAEPATPASARPLTGRAARRARAQAAAARRPAPPVVQAPATVFLEGQVVQPRRTLETPDGPLVLLHEDAWLLAFEKPSGMHSVPGKGEDKQDCLSRRAQSLYPDALVVHRLDLDTSGIVVMARGAEAQRRLNKSFEERKVHKRYVAVVQGCLRPPAGLWGLIDLPIALDWPLRPRHKVDPVQGRPSQTHWQVLSVDERAQTSRVLLEPFTGRSHQLRVHLQAIGHPILGDRLYGEPTVVARAPRLLLHATQLQLPHPQTGAMCFFESPVPF